MASAATALADRQIVFNVLHKLSDMKYKDRRQRGPEDPVELLEFRPTLVPAILVNKLWADEGTSVLWKRYPHLPALQHMDSTRRQYYANKVQQIYMLNPPLGVANPFEYLRYVNWPKLRSLELEIDFIRHGPDFRNMLQAELDHVELSGKQSGGAAYFAEVVLPLLLHSPKLKSLRFGPAIFSDDDPVHASVLYDHLDAVPSIQNVELRSAGFYDVDSLFMHLSQYGDLEGLEIDLEPGLALLPQLEGPNALPDPFAFLKRLSIMCYPEIAKSIVRHLKCMEELQFDICRIPDQAVQESDTTIIEDLIGQLAHCPRLVSLKVGIGALAQGYPSTSMGPVLGGAALVQLATSCPSLEEIALFASEPSAIDGSDITPDDFDAFCQALPRLRTLSLKLHPRSGHDLTESALQSLGTHCSELSVLRLKIPFDLSTLPLPPCSLPSILVSAPATPSEEKTDVFESSTSNAVTESGPLFPHLTHLALSRPETVLCAFPDAISSTSSEYLDVDPEIEEDLVRLWARPLLVHFPRIEILEAWGDWSGDNETLNYFLPAEEILASTWEFLSGAEQNLWEDDADSGSYETYNSSGGDWENASYFNEYNDEEGVMSSGRYVEEPDGMATPGRTISSDEYFEDKGGVGGDNPSLRKISGPQEMGGLVDAHLPVIAPERELANIRI